MIPILKTDFPVAYASPDHLMPWGTKHDNSRNPRFVRKILRIPAAKRVGFGILDLGCSGGAFARDCLNQGWEAVGLEGSDYSKKMRRAEWAVIPHRLFTCDVGKPFEITDGENGAPAFFDLITSWELLEHLTEDQVGVLTNNVRSHLKPNGLWIVSISPNEDCANGVHLHQTVKPKEWWERKLSSHGFHRQPSIERYFAGQYVRGPKFAAPRSFNFVLGQKPNIDLEIPQRSLMHKLLDLWNGSFPHRALKTLISGVPS